MSRLKTSAQLEVDLARRLSMLAVSCGVLALLAHPALAWQTSKDSAAQKDSSYIDADGTAHITRVVPLPATISPEAQKGLAHQASDAKPNQTLEQRRAETDAAAAAGAKAEPRRLSSEYHIVDDCRDTGLGGDSCRRRPGG